MLRSPTLPATWRGLLEMFRPAFRRSRTFGLFVLLATGLVAQTARRTVVGMLVGAGVAAVVSFHACCRFFSHHRWDVDRIGLVLARLIVDRLLYAGAPIVVVVDDTLFRRWGPKVFGAFWTHDGSGQDPNALGRGNRWVIAGGSLLRRERKHARRSHTNSGQSERSRCRRVAPADTLAGRARGWRAGDRKAVAVEQRP